VQHPGAGVGAYRHDSHASADVVVGSIDRIGAYGAGCVRQYRAFSPRPPRSVFAACASWLCRWPARPVRPPYNREEIQARLTSDLHALGIPRLDAQETLKRPKIPHRVQHRSDLLPERVRSLR
jgi:hypothetical protein